MKRPRIDGWTFGTIVIAALIALPLATVMALALAPGGGIWDHLVSTVLMLYVETTVSLMVLVGAGTLVIGAGCAWLVTMCRFPGVRFFEWALILPLAVPAYVVAYVYTDLLDYAGPVQGTLRRALGWRSRADYWFPEIRSTGGAALMMTLVFYPYVYLLARAAFLEQSACALEVSRTLGKSATASFFRVALPLARPALVVGLSLVMMETLNDFGTVDFFAVKTLTAGIYDVWLNMNSTAGAAQLASLMLAFVLGLVAAERWARRGQRYHHTSVRYSALPSYPLRGAAGALAIAVCALPLSLGFVVPACVLLDYALARAGDAPSQNVALYAANSLLLSSSSALVATLVGLFLAYGMRQSRAPAVRAATRFATIGYAVPGAVLAVGVMIPVAWLDNRIADAWKALFGASPGLLVSGTFLVIAVGYVVRFLALSFGAVEAGLAKITPAMDGVARTLGHGPAQTLGRVHLPLMRASVLTAVLLVFVDGMKELPMTMLLRPFNFDTLATYVHQFASLEMLEECALGALAIVAAGVLPVAALSVTIARSRPGAAAAPAAALARP